MTENPQAEQHLSDLDLALDMADAADRISMKHYFATHLDVQLKPDHTPVTEADKAVEKRLRSALKKLRPADGIIGEEFGGATWSHLPSGRTWVIDPIDATKNYMRHVPVWATLIALLVDGVPELGVVSAPALGRRWWAQSGQGAWLSEPGRRVHHLGVSSVASLSDASFSYSDSAGWADQDALGGLDVLVADCWRTRAYGDYWSHMLVAEGAVDIAVETELKIWDMAALVAIVREAGGRATSFDGGDPLLGSSIVSSNGLLHDAVLAALGRDKAS